MARKPRLPQDKVPAFYKFVDCRENHHWRRRDDSPSRSQEGGWWFIYDCLNCGAIRRTYVNITGRRDPSRCSYVYPEGYKLEKGLTKADFRVHAIHEALNRDE